MDNRKQNTAGFVFPAEKFEEALSRADILLKLRLAVDHLYIKGYRTFITGLESGTDLLAADEVCSMKQSGRYPGMRLIACTAFPEQARGYDGPSRTMYEDIVARLDGLSIVSGEESGIADRNSRIIGESAAVLYIGDEPVLNEFILCAKEQGAALFDINNMPPAE